MGLFVRLGGIVHDESACAGVVAMWRMLSRSAGAWTEAWQPLAGPSPDRAFSAILDNNANRDELVADPICGCVVTCRSRGLPCIDQTLDLCCRFVCP